jgi:tetratricopeptide (TPR) repeat protein
VGRADQLAAFGVMAGLVCYIKGTIATEPRRVAWASALTAAAGIGLFSKENAAVLPGIMLLYDLTWPTKRRPGRALFYTALVLPFGLFAYLRSGVATRLAFDFGENPLIAAGFWTGRLTGVKVIGKYLRLFAWPARLSPDYSYNAVSLANWADLQALVAPAVCATAAVLAVRCFRGNKPLFFFLLFFVAALLPTSNLLFLIGSIMAERFLYLPAVGLAGCAVAALRLLARRYPRPAWAAAALVSVALGARTYARNSDWRDELSLWTSAAVACPESYKVHDSLGNALPEAGRLPEAISEYQASLRIEPNFAEGHYNLGVALAQMPGRLPEAIAEHRAALRKNPISWTRTTTAVWRCHKFPAACPTRSPSTRRCCAPAPITGRHTTTSAAR